MTDELTEALWKEIRDTRALLGRLVNHLLSEEQIKEQHDECVIVDSIHTLMQEYIAHQLKREAALDAHNKQVETLLLKMVYELQHPSPRL